MTRLEHTADLLIETLEGQIKAGLNLPVDVILAMDKYKRIQIEEDKLITEEFRLMSEKI